MTPLLAFVASYAGFAALAFAMDRHHRQLRERSSTTGVRLGLRVIGAVSLSHAFYASVTYAGWSIGPVLWFGMISASALVLVVVLAYAPRVAAVAGVVALPCGMAAIF